jgi:hypothetical protein
MDRVAGAGLNGAKEAPGFQAATLQSKTLADYCNSPLAPRDYRNERQVVAATFHHSSGDYIDLVVGNSIDQSEMTNEVVEISEPEAKAADLKFQICRRAIFRKLNSEY